MRVLAAPDSFKGVLSAADAAAALVAGVRRGRPDADAVPLPLADGGEGTLEVLVRAAGGSRRSLTATGPLGNPVETTIGLIHEATTAVVELAGVAGYALVPPERRDPLRTTTYGLGEVLRAVVESGVENIILAVGGSATVDGGAGLMQALGLLLLDADGRPIRRPVAGGDLRAIRRVEWHDPPENLEHAQLTVAVDVLNPACGPHGAAAVFGPQKGATPEAVRILDAGLAHWVGLLENLAGRPVREESGTGAAGGVALPLVALLGASIVPGIDVVSEAVKLPGQIAESDLVLTGEGRIDRQSLMGKVVGSVGRMARTAGVPCVAVAGIAGEGAEDCLAVLDRIETLNAPLDQTARRLEEVAAALAARWL